jgi:CheY-like chemotaxis protein
MEAQDIFLLVEDSQDDVLLIRRAFAKAAILNPLQVVTNGDEAIRYLKGAAPYGDRVQFPLPELVLLDLKMPGTDGFQVLRWIRQQPEFKELRVVVLTSSSEIRDMNLAYELGANSYLVKPIDFERFVEISQALKGAWLWMRKVPAMGFLPLGSTLAPGKTAHADPGNSPLRS